DRVPPPGGGLSTGHTAPHSSAPPAARRCALIGIGQRGRQRPAVVIEPVAGIDCTSSADCRRLARALREFGKTHPHAERIKTFYFHPRLPVDVRHNAKIHRLTLARWASGHHGFESDPKR